MLLATALLQTAEPAGSQGSQSNVTGVPTSAFLNFGAIGLVALLCVSATVYMFLTLQRERNKYTADLKASEDAHREEMKALVERYIAASNTHVKEYHALADKITAVLESLTRRVERRGR